MQDAVRRNPTRRRTSRETVRATDWVELAALRLVAWILGALPVDRGSALMGWVWRKVAPFNARHARADRHLAAVMPELSPAERRALLDRMWDNLGRVAAESFRLADIMADPDRFEHAFTALEAHRADLARGAVFASLHQGNWELAGWGIRLAGFQVAAVYNPLKNPLAEAFLLDRRTPVYDQGLFTRDRVSALKLRSLARQGVAIGMLADLHDYTGVEADFLGHRARLATYPAVLARRLGVPLVVGRVLRTTGVHFRVEAEVIDVPVTDDVDADIRAGALAMHRRFETYIREAPDQWMWAHRKWLTLR
nr:lauroyl acyltransferase [Chthonobacter rhizosphaerae]